VTRPMLALPVGPEGADIARGREWGPRLHVRGRWPEVERELSAVLHAALADPDRAHIVRIGGKDWAFSGPSAAGELLHGAPLQFIGRPRDPAWALVRVRMSVEVLDGLP
jgi:hypothetical protein